MVLYHTSQEIIKRPDIYFGRKNADFGQGFYLTQDYDFAQRWASADAFINEYELCLDDLCVIQLERNREWFEYIFENRRTNDTKSADVIIGPIANDTIFDTLGIISSGFLKPEEAVELLMIGPEYIQVTVKTDKANKQLKWLSADKVHISEVVRNKRIQEEIWYQEAFAARMVKL